LILIQGKNNMNYFNCLVFSILINFQYSVIVIYRYFCDKLIHEKLFINIY
jgi:hypothetical protein